jgi:hypothetical protein
VEPALLIFDNAKFARLMKGRLWFYQHAPAHFETTWLIRNELSRIGHNFFHVPFQTFWRLRTGEGVANPATILPELRGSVLSAGEVEATQAFERLAALPCPAGEERERAAAIVAVFDEFFHALYKIAAEG